MAVIFISFCFNKTRINKQDIRSIDEGDADERLIVRIVVVLLMLPPIAISIVANEPMIAKGIIFGFAAVYGISLVTWFAMGTCRLLWVISTTLLSKSGEKE